MKFSDLKLDARVLRAVEETGYVEPTPIQAQAIPHALEGRDVLGIAQTGTGKTASFTLPMISLLAKGRARARMPRSLILCPTRELAAQVADNFTAYGKHLKLSMALLIGGVSFAEQDKIIDRGVDVLIATPGRLIDHFERGKLMLTGIEIMVVDEADRMLDMGFIEDLERIFKLTPFTRQTLFFSATMPPEITRLTDEFLSNPIRVEVARQATTAETVDQKLCLVPTLPKDRGDRQKRAALRKLIADEGEALTNAIIFCNRKRDVSVLFKSLTSHGLNVGALHGDLDQRVRMQVLDGFRNDQITLLVASDVAARGLDIPNVSHVFNFDVPINAEDYVHRIGRTGRAGRSGTAFTLSTSGDAKLLAKVEEMIGREIPRIELEGVTDVDPAAAAEEDGRREKRSDRRRDRDGRDRDGRDRDRDRDRERSSRDGDGERERERSSARRDAAIADDTRRSRGGRRGRRYEEPDEPVVGMGDHVPAFMLRQFSIPSFSNTGADHDGADDAERVEETAAANANSPEETAASEAA